MIFVYLSASAGRVILHQAVEVEAFQDDSDEVRFLDVAGEVVAVFRRADVALYTQNDYGSVVADSDRPTAENP